jgi:hypothetical protein
VDADTHTGNIEGIYHLRNPRVQPHLFKGCQAMRIWVSGVNLSPLCRSKSLCSPRPVLRSIYGHLLDVLWIILEVLARWAFFLVFAPPGGVPAPETNPYIARYVI